MKPLRKRKEHIVSTWVDYDTKDALYKIAYHEGTSVANVARNLIEKGVKEYGK